MTKNIVFDVVGTCVGYQAFFDGIATHIGPRLLSHNILPQLFGFAWMESAEREFTYLSISGRYCPFKKVFRSMFYRMLWMSGIQDPRSFATDEERDAICATYSDLTLREGIKETFELLRANGFTIWAFTSGDVERVRGYFLRAGVDMPMQNFKSCDTEGVAKPALDAYKPVLASFAEGDENWFFAAHYWDVSAAKKIGFKGAYCSVYEKEDCADLFDVTMDVMGDTPVETARKVIEASSKA